MPQPTVLELFLRRISAATGSHVTSAAVLVGLVAAGHALGTAVVYQLSHVPSVGVTFFPASGVTVAASAAVAPPAMAGGFGRHLSLRADQPFRSR